MSIDNKNIGLEQAMRALQSGGDEAAMCLERMTRKERQATLFAKHESCVPVLVHATTYEFQRSPAETSSFLVLMHNIAVNDAGRKSLAAHGAVPLLKSIACDDTQVLAARVSNPNRLRAAMVLDAMHEDLDAVFNDNFVKLIRGHWREWSYALIDIPPHYSARFVQTSADVSELFDIIFSEREVAGPLHVIANTLAYYFTLPVTQKAEALPKILLIAQNERIQGVAKELLKQYLDPDKHIRNLKLVCGAALSLVNDSIRSLIVEEGL